MGSALCARLITRPCRYSQRTPLCVDFLAGFQKAAPRVVSCRAAVGVAILRLDRAIPPLLPAEAGAAMMVRCRRAQRPRLLIALTVRADCAVAGAHFAAPTGMRMALHFAAIRRCAHRTQLRAVARRTTKARACANLRIDCKQ
jgi:hypothetical protein